MKKDAELNAAADAAKKEAIEAKNIAEQLAYTAEKAMKEAGEKVPADLRKSIEDKIADLKRVKDSATPDLAAIKTATTALSDEIQKIGQYMNQQRTGRPMRPGGSTGPEQGGDNVKDAEFKEKK